MTLVHKTIIMWDEIMDMPGEIFDFDGWIEEVASDPEFIAEVDKNNAQFDLEVSQLSVWFSFPSQYLIHHGPTRFAGI